MGDCSHPTTSYDMDKDYFIIERCLICGDERICPFDWGQENVNKVTEYLEEEF